MKYISYKAVKERFILSGLSSPNQESLDIVNAAVSSIIDSIVLFANKRKIRKSRRIIDTLPDSIGKEKAPSRAVSPIISEPFEPEPEQVEPTAEQAEADKNVDEMVNEAEAANPLPEPDLVPTPALETTPAPEPEPPAPTEEPEVVETEQSAAPDPVPDSNSISCWACHFHVPTKEGDMFCRNDKSPRHRQMVATTDTCDFAEPRR